MLDSAVLTFSDPQHHQAAIRAGDVKVLVTAPGEYRADLTRIDLHRLWMQRGRETLPRIAQVNLARGRSPIFFHADTDQASSVHSGMELQSDDIMFYSPGSVHHLHTSAECRWGAMSLTPDDLAAAGRAIAGVDIVAPSVTQKLHAPPHLMARLRSVHAAAGHLAATTPDILVHPEVARAMEHELVRAMIGCLSEGKAESAAPGHQRIAVMQRFEQVLNESEGQPRYVAEICAAIGVAERTLRLHCLEHLGLSPHRYLWLRRMYQARQALSLADATATNVSTIATDHGFWEFGRFSVAYRKLFGETPSATLRRAQDHAPIWSVQGISTGRLPILP